MKGSKKLKPKNVSVILPCAGQGKRLGLDYPKELFEVCPGTRLIDFSLRHIRTYLDLQLDSREEGTFKIVVVIRPGKDNVFEYVQQLFSGVIVEKALFNKSYREWPGSVYSAKPQFSDMNLVLLPDNYLEFKPGFTYIDEKGNTLIGNCLKKLNQFPVIFGYVNCSQPELLSSLGAVKVTSDQKIIDFQDKPVNSFNRYNAYWTCYGFMRDTGKRLYDFLIDSVDHKHSNPREADFLPFGACKIAAQYDLGTWSSIAQFRTRKCK